MVESNTIQTPKLTKKDYLITSLRSYFLQNGFNYTTYQGTSYAYMIFPALKKIYAGKIGYHTDNKQKCVGYKNLR